MNYSDYRFTLDVQIHQAQVSVPVSFGDSARRLCIGLTDGRKPYVITEGCIAVFNAKKPDGKVIKAPCIIERNVILYDFLEQTTNSEGIVYCSITIYDTDGTVLTSPQFTIVVDKRVVRDNEVALSADDYSAFDNIFTYEAQRQTAEEQRLTTEGSIEPESEYYGGRALAEADRVAAEKARLKTEGSIEPESEYYGGRAVAEAERAKKEIDRLSAEEARLIAEGSADPKSKYYGGRALAEKERSSLGLIVKNGRVCLKFDN